MIEFNTLHASHNIMGDDRDKWLELDSNWKPVGPEKTDFHADNDRFPSSEWEGWFRKKSRNPGAALLFPIAWSAFFLLIAPLPQIASGFTPDDRTASAALFLTAWVLVVIPLISTGSLARHPLNSHVLDIYPLDMPSMALASALFLLHVLTNPILGWMSYLVFWYSWLKAVRNLSAATHYSAGAWLKQIDPANYSKLQLSSDWGLTENFFKAGILGTGPSLSANSILVIEGIRREESAYISIAVLHRSGYRHDPFQERLEPERIDELLRSPPVF